MDNKTINDILNMMLPSNRVQVGLTSENDRFGNNAVLPAELKKTIDTIYHTVEQIISSNGINGAAVINMIDSKRGEINKYTEVLYGQKANRQLEKVKALLEDMQKKGDEKSENKPENRNQKVNKEMEDERVNHAISEAVTKKMNESIYKIRETIVRDLSMRGVPPMEIQKKLTRCTMEMVNNFRRNKRKSKK